MELNKSWFAALLLVFLVAAGIYFVAVSRYGKISDSAYELAKAAYNASAAQNLERIEKVEHLFNDPEFSDQLTEREKKWFVTIFEDARNGRWKDAAAFSRRILESQVEY